MATKSKTAKDSKEPSKRELQLQMEEARESLTHTVEAIKETVSDQYEAVKETVSDVLDWREQFAKNPVVWGIGAVTFGLVVGYSIAVARNVAPPSRRRRSEAQSTMDHLFDELAVVGETFMLPMVMGKIKETFGVDLSHLLESRAEERRRPATKGARKKGGAKKRANKKRSAKKQ
ncbi:MAG: hypothetical protein AUG51_22430 [Acidobacteria bacterium 13_1_20CM_3_53_8]|nr:MAG: hypothetical protein AUG51_22430 [Acidobacteria bacterium 13_1_20CM_3_53_8]